MIVGEMIIDEMKLIARKQKRAVLFADETIVDNESVLLLITMTQQS